MPCGDNYSNTVNDCYSEITDLRARCDKLAQMLCWLCGELEEANSTSCFEQNSRLRDWWIQHKRDDEKRVMSEMTAYIMNNQHITPQALAANFIARAERVHVNKYGEGAMDKLYSFFWFKQG